VGGAGGGELLDTCKIQRDKTRKVGIRRLPTVGGWGFSDALHRTGRSPFDTQGALPRCLRIDVVGNLTHEKMQTQVLEVSLAYGFRVLGEQAPGVHVSSYGSIGRHRPGIA
jgi:hypothetical protein